MTTKRNVTQAKWRASTDRRKVGAHLPAALVEQLDTLVRAGGHRGRVEVLATLIREHTERAQAPAGPSLHVDRDYDRVRKANGTQQPMARAAFRWRPDLDRGMPVLRESLPLVAETPSARFHENDSPGMPFLC